MYIQTFYFMIARFESWTYNDEELERVNVGLLHLVHLTHYQRPGVLQHKSDFLNQNSVVLFYNKTEMSCAA